MKNNPDCTQWRNKEETWYFKTVSLPMKRNMKSLPWETDQLKQEEQSEDCAGEPHSEMSLRQWAGPRALPKPNDWENAA